MISQRTKANFIEFLQVMARSEKKLEFFRQKLSELEDFEPYAAFKRIARISKSYLNAVDFRNFLRDNSFEFSEEECRICLIEFYDKDLDQGLNYAEFLQAILPRDNPVVRSVVTQRPTYEVKEGQILPEEVESCLAQLLRSEIESYFLLEPLKCQLQECEDYSVEILFELIDDEDKDSLNFDSLLNFCQKNQFYAYEEEVISILRRMDRKNDGQINFQEFQQGMTPTFGKQKIKQNHQTWQKNTPEDIQLSKYKKKYRKQQSPTHNEEKASFKYQGQQLFATPPKGENPDFEPSESVQRYTSQKRMQCRDRYLSPSRLQYPFEPKRRLLSPENAYFSGHSSKARNQCQKIDNPHSSPRIQVHHKHHNSAEYVQQDYKQDKHIISKFLRLLKKIVTLEKDTELYKQELVLRPDFNIEDMWQCFVSKQTGQIPLDVFEDILAQIDVFPKKQDLYLFYEQYGANKNAGKFRFSEFFEIFNPTSQEYSDLFQERKRISKKGELFRINNVFSEETLKKISLLFKSHFEKESQVNQIRKEIRRTMDLDQRQLYGILNQNQGRLVEFRDLHQVFEENDIFCSEREIKLLLKRFNSSGKSYISFEDFAEQINPIITKQYE